MLLSPKVVLFLTLLQYVAHLISRGRITQSPFSGTTPQQVEVRVFANEHANNNANSSFTVNPRRMQRKPETYLYQTYCIPTLYSTFNLQEIT